MRLHIDEHQPRRVEVESSVEPRLTARQDVGAVLLGRVCGLFCA